jgi:hypothetical protein
MFFFLRGALPESRLFFVNKKQLTPAESNAVLRSRARRAEDLDVRETTEMVAAGRCRCGCGLRAMIEGYAPACHAAHLKAVRTVFRGL